MERIRGELITLLVNPRQLPVNLEDQVIKLHHDLTRYVRRQIKSPLSLPASPPSTARSQQDSPSHDDEFPPCSRENDKEEGEYEEPTDEEVKAVAEMLDRLKPNLVFTQEPNEDNNEEQENDDEEVEEVVEGLYEPTEEDVACFNKMLADELDKDNNEVEGVDNEDEGVEDEGVEDEGVEDEGVDDEDEGVDSASSPPLKDRLRKKPHDSADIYKGCIGKSSR